MTNSTLPLTQLPGVWRASEGRHQDTLQRQDTGFTALNTALGGGFPASGLIRLRSLCGVGELSLLKTVLGQNNNDKLLVFINPPGHIHQAWLHQMAINPATVTVVQCRSGDEALWAAEQCLKSEACYQVLLWHDAITSKQARRLQVASTQHQLRCLLYENKRVQRIALPLTLDLDIHAVTGGLQIDITKNRGAWPTSATHLAFCYTPTNQAIYQAMDNTIALRALAPIAG